MNAFRPAQRIRPCRQGAAAPVLGAVDHDSCDAAQHMSREQSGTIYDRKPVVLRQEIKRLLAPFRMEKSGGVLKCRVAIAVTKFIQQRRRQRGAYTRSVSS